LAKIAAELEQALARRVRDGARGALASRLLAQGDGWTVEDVVCTCGPRDRPFEENHGCFRIAMVVAGTFEYRGTFGRELMTPGSLLLGNEGQNFECSHEHASGDRCISFGYSAACFEPLAEGVGVKKPGAGFRRLRLPPVREFASVAARVYASLAERGHRSPRASQGWEELSLQLAAAAIRLASDALLRAASPPASSVARVTRAVRLIERDPSAVLPLGDLAFEAGLSRYHFLRTFELVTGLTPHRYVRRARLRRAASRVAVGPEKITGIALDTGFGDIANFNHAFRAEFGLSPRAYRAQLGAVMNARFRSHE
jgi:AraC-like DNA-binding protein